MKLRSSFLFILLAASSFHCNATSTCGQKEMCDSYMDLAIDMIVRAKHAIPTCPKIHMLSKSTLGGGQPVDCADILHMGYNKSGIYEIWPMSRMTEERPLNVSCDMDTDGGGWTNLDPAFRYILIGYLCIHNFFEVIQRRGDFGSSKEYFYQNWESYKEGFGDVEKDFWLGNDNIFALTNQKLYSARFDLMDGQQNKAFAQYEKFWIDDENNKYKLHISIYSGNAGDAMTVEHNNRKFSTKDQDNDNSRRNCAVNFGGAWWYDDCYQANLNGLLLKGKSEPHYKGANWNVWKGDKESMVWTEIKVRPRNFIRSSIASEVTPS